MSYILFIVIFLITGVGIVAQFDTIKRKGQLFGAGILMGMAVSTLTIYVMELLYVKLTYTSVLGISVAVMLVANIGYKKTIETLKESFSIKVPLKLYEIPFFAFAGYLVVISVWRAYYLPVTPYDTIVGMDFVAKYAALEGHVVSSVFTEQFSKVRDFNQPFYAPFTTFSQIIYRLSGFENGQGWLSVVFISFLAFFYCKLKELTHPIFAGIFLLLFIAIPELYAYTFMFLTDFSNAVFFGIGSILYYEYFKNRNIKTLLLSALFMGFSVWSRSETVLFMPFLSLLILATGIKTDLKNSFIHSALFSAVPALFFVLWNIIMFKLYFNYFPQNQFAVNPTMGLTDIFSEINTKLITNEFLYGYAFNLFFVFAIANLVLFRNKTGYELLWVVVTLYVGFGIIVFLFPAASIDNTIKRSFFKFFPVFFFYLASSSLFNYLTEKLNNFER